jgi:hypothetical protein
MEPNGFHHELTAQEIIDIEDVVIEPHIVPQWNNGLVYVRSVSAKERGNIERDAALFKEQKGKNTDFARDFTVKFAWLAMCDKNGRRLFDKIEDVARLKEKNAAAIAAIAAHAQRLSGFSKEDLEKLEKNLEPAQPDDSPSA